MRHRNIPHIEWHDDHKNIMLSVHCHGCDIPLQATVLTNTVLHKREINGQLVLHHLGTMTQLPSYNEHTIHMDDGTDHVMGLCKDCAAKATHHDLLKWYKNDIEAWKHESRLTGKPCPKWLTTRKPLQPEVVS